MLNEALDIFRAKNIDDNWPMLAQFGRGTALAQLGRLVEAEPMLTAVWPRFAAENRIPAWQKRQAVAELAKLYEQAGQADKAAAWRGRLERDVK